VAEVSPPPPERATSSLASRLIPMGVWCDFGRNRRTEKTGAIYASNIVAARMKFLEQCDRTLLRASLTLDFGRLMGVLLQGFRLCVHLGTPSYLNFAHVDFTSRV
jgi:hypothetical protein